MVNRNRSREEIISSPDGRKAGTNPRERADQKGRCEEGAFIRLRFHSLIIMLFLISL